MKYALVCGALSGLAQASISELSLDNYTIFAADIMIKEVNVENNIHYIPCDVTNNQSIKDMYTYVSSITSKLDLIVNYAGIVIIGSLIESNIDALNKILEINTISTYKLINVFFPLLKEGRGRIIVISSEYGRIDAIPFHGFYTLSKHAVEVYIDALRRELMFLGIKVVGIRPGAFKTKMQAGIQNQFDQLINSTKDYKEILFKMSHMMDKELFKAKDVKQYQKTFKKAYISKKPKYFYNVNNSFKMKLLSIMPKKIQDFIFMNFFK